MKKKYTWLLAGLLLWATASSAQTALPPREEYKLLASASTIAIARGGRQDSVKLSVLRSRSFKTGKASIVLNAPAAAGLSVDIKQLPNHPDEYMLYFSATPVAQAGEYSFVPTCTLHNKSKGIILKLIIQ